MPRQLERPQQAPKIKAANALALRVLSHHREMHALLQERKYYVTYREYSGGHNYTAWRDDVWRGLEKLFR